MNIIELARECNGDLTTFGGEPLCYTFAIANLEKFAKAVIAAYVAEQKPAYWVLKTGHGIDIQEFKPVCEIDYWKPIYTLENQNDNR